MYYIYVLKSSQNRKFYIGYTSDLKRRFEEHNLGKVKYTRKFKPWSLVYYEAYVLESYARYREKQLKHHGKIYSQLIKRIEKSLEGERK